MKKQEDFKTIMVRLPGNPGRQHSLDLIARISGDFQTMLEATEIPEEVDQIELMVLVDENYALCGYRMSCLSLSAWRGKENYLRKEVEYTLTQLEQFKQTKMEEKTQ